MPDALMIRAASITIATPAPLSAAPSPSDPAVEVRAGHHIAGLGIGAGDVGDDVVGLGVAVVISDRAVDLERRRGAHLRQPREPAVILRCDLEARERRRGADLELAVLAVNQLAVEARHGGIGDRALFLEERVAARREGEAVGAGGGSAGGSAGAGAGLRWPVELVGLGEIVGGVALERRIARLGEVGRAR